MTIRTDDFDFTLPQELIAQTPLENRSASRLMVIHRETGEIEHKTFADIIDYLNEGDLLVANNSKVIPARLLGKKENIENGANVEVFLLKQLDDTCWQCLLKPAKRLKIGTKILFKPGLTGFVEKKNEDGTGEVRFEFEGEFLTIISDFGQMPLPPYIKEKLKDKDRYQTVYANDLGSVAAPTAGLHFTKELLEKIASKGIEIEYVTLNVGLGTFLPVKVEDASKHKMHEENYTISPQVAKRINEAKSKGRRIVAVGTTTVRTLEANARENAGKIVPGHFSTDIFIYPGFPFLMTDSLITNFHLPKSTLIMLVSAFYNKEGVLTAYEEAVKERYRFFSFGDSMLLL